LVIESWSFIASVTKPERLGKYSSVASESDLGEYSADCQEGEINRSGTLGRRMRFAYPPYKSAPH
jgi:hypothetical protein